MKTSKYIVLAGAALLFTACSDFLNNDSPSAMGSNYVYSSPERCEQAIAGVYELFGANNSYRNRMACGFQGLNTDIEHCTYSSSEKDHQQQVALYNMPLANSNVSNADNADIWSYLNVGIERCNNVVDGIEVYAERDAEGKYDPRTTYILGEAHFLRAFMYLEMLKYWGDVPLRYHSLGVDPAGAAAIKTDRNLIYEFIREDLNKAAELMPWSAECPGSAANSIERPSRGAALALLARADLMYAGKSVRPDQLIPGGTSACSVRYNIEDAAKRQEVYQEALEACAEIIKNEDGKFQDSFEKVFKDLCADKVAYNEMEYFWAIPFASGARGQFLNYNCPKLTGTDQKDALKGHLKNFDPNCSTSSVQTVSPVMIFEFESGDKRKETTFVPGTWYYSDASANISDDKKREDVFGGLNPYHERLYEKLSKIDKFYLGKYRVEWMSHMHTTTDDGVDFPIIRYADVLLMFAEASIGGISGDAPANTTGIVGVDMLNKVRARAGLPAAASVTMDAIMHERACELCGEYVRKWDLMRWGNLPEKMIAARETLDKIVTDRASLQLNDTLYFQFRYNEEVGGYEINRQTMYGLAYGELGRPAAYDSTWVKASIYVSKDEKTGAEEEVLGSAKYPLYEREEYLTTHQYWPIFSVNVDVSNGALWNDYGYNEY